jgi:hypothetical protein
MNTDTNTKQFTENTVLERIQSGSVRMHSRAFFILQGAAIAALALVVFALSALVVSYVIFGLRINGHEALLGFGLRGAGLFLLVLPWPLIALDALMVALLAWMLRRFRFGYRNPSLYLGAALLVCAVALGFGFDQTTHLHDRLLEATERDELPQIIETFYVDVRTATPTENGIYRGEVREVREDGIVISHDDGDDDGDDGTHFVKFPEGYEHEKLEEGDRVYVAGDDDDASEEDEDDIRAFGIREMEDD